jgi:DnaJ-class molecular chaperone
MSLPNVQKTKCPECNGFGVRYGPNDQHTPEWMCQRCGMTGEIDVKPAMCAACDGKGFYWFWSNGRRVRVRCLACTPAPVDPFRHWS